MIFGISDTVRLAREKKFSELWARGIRKFAWFPVRLQDGRFVWMHHYWSYCGSLRKNIYMKNGEYVTDVWAERSIYSEVRNHLHSDPEHIRWVS